MDKKKTIFCCQSTLFISKWLLCVWVWHQRLGHSLWHHEIMSTRNDPNENGTLNVLCPFQFYSLRLVMNEPAPDRSNIWSAQYRIISLFYFVMAQIWGNDFTFEFAAKLNENFGWNSVSERWCDCQCTLYRSKMNFLFNKQAKRICFIASVWLVCMKTVIKLMSLVLLNVSFTHHKHKRHCYWKYKWSSDKSIAAKNSSTWNARLSL